MTWGRMAALSRRMGIGTGMRIRQVRTVAQDSAQCSTVSSRAPAEPAGATATVFTTCCRAGVRRWYRTVNPVTCSAKVAFGADRGVETIPSSVLRPLTLLYP